ncbi:GNAT family N-acetyltransferase, partial [Candidatus Latescibacterota bacterium]
VEHTDELIEVPPSEPDDVSESIAKHISRLVENGSTIQVGIGKIPNAVLHYLGVHTEMLSDGFIDLIDSGVINNSKKTFHPGKILAAYCIGTRKLYDYVDNNPMFEFHPTDYNSSPLNIAKNEKMVAINTALEVDLTGQVCSGSLGYKIYSGIGGQADFMRGAALAPQGKPIIALSSTAKNGTVSRIVPHLSEGAGVVITRGDVHYIATEYGVTYLHGKSLRERVISLINIAHPKFRDELLAQAKKHKYLFEDQFIPSGAVYPVEIEHTQQFDDIGLFFRPAKPSDERMLQEFLYQLSEKSVYQRFFHKMKAFPHELAQDMVSIDYNEKMGVVGILGSPGNERIVANGHWIMSVNESIAEVAFAVADKYQRRGIGTHFLKLLMRLAKEKGIHGFEASVISGNIGMMNVFKKSGCVIHSEFESGMYTLHFDFDEKTTE